MTGHTSWKELKKKMPKEQMLTINRVAQSQAAFIDGYHLAVSDIVDFLRLHHKEWEIAEIADSIEKEFKA